MRLFFYLVLGLFIAGPIRAEVNFPSPPPNKSFIKDETGIINSEIAEKINQASASLYAEKRVPLFVCVIESLASKNAADQNIEVYAQKVFDRWGIGTKAENYGILLFISKGDKKARIEFGQAWNHKYDSAAQNIMDTVIIPAFKHGDYSSGIGNGVAALDALARGLPLPEVKRPIWLVPALCVGLIVLLAFVYSLFKTGRKGWAWAVIGAVAIILFLFYDIAIKGGSSGRGGGSSGGGGASGSW